MMRRVRVRRDSASTGELEWASFDAKGALLATGTAPAGESPFVGPCELVLAADLVALDEFRLPDAQRQRLAGALRFAVEDKSAADPERLHVAEARESGERGARVALVDRDWLALTLRHLRQRGLAPVRAYPESLLPALPDQGWVVVRGPDDSFVRTAALDAFTLDQAGKDEVPAALRLAASAQRPGRIVVRCAPGADMPDLAAWSQVLRVPVEPGPPWRWSEPQAAPELDLLQGEFGGSAAARRSRQPAIRAAWLLAALVISSSAGLGLDWWRMAREERALRQEMASIYRATFGEQAVVVDPALQMRRAADELLRAGAGPADFMPLLASLSAKLESAAIRLERVSFEQGLLRASVLAPAGETGALLARLRAPAGGVRLSAEPGPTPGRIEVQVSQGAVQ